jgi:hypothetical protein
MNAIRWHAATCIAAALLAAAPAAAQRVTLRGQVVDAQSGQPIPAAVVELMPRHETVLTDAQGRFTVKSQRGDHGVVADAMGYSGFIGAVSMPSDTNEVKLTLQRDPVMLAGITATVDRLRSRRRAAPYAVRTLDAVQIATSGAPDAYTLVQERLGVYFTPCLRSAGSTCIYARGRQQPASVVVDEMWVPDAFVLRTYAPADIALVESYRNGAQIRLYTRWWMDRAARYHIQPLPLYVVG